MKLIMFPKEPSVQYIIALIVHSILKWNRQKTIRQNTMIISQHSRHDLTMYGRRL